MFLPPSLPFIYILYIVTGSDLMNCMVWTQLLTDLPWPALSNFEHERAPNQFSLLSNIILTPPGAYLKYEAGGGERFNFKKISDSQNLYSFM